MTELRVSIHKAARRHRCVYCGQHIHKGEVYTKRVYVFNGDFQSEALHNECYDAMFLADIDPYEGFEPHSFQRGKPELRQEWS